MFEIHNLKHRYGATEVLNVASWRVEQGSQWLVLGPSGSGKTTLLHAVAGVLRPSEGSISVAARTSAHCPPTSSTDSGGAHRAVLQRLHLMASLNVMDNLLLAQYLAGLPQDRERAGEVLAGLDVAARVSAFPHELSFGQAQRVAVARAVVNKPKVLLADEPTSNLDDERCMQALELLQSQARACNATLVIATHDQRIRARIPDHFALGARP